MTGSHSVRESLSPMTPASQANSSGDIAAERLARYAYVGHGKLPLDEPPDPGEQQRRSRRGGYH